MKKLHPITSGILQAITAGFLIAFLFVCSLGIVSAYLQPFYEFMDRSPMTGVVLFCLGLLSLSVLFFSGVLKRN